MILETYLVLKVFYEIIIYNNNLRVCDNYAKRYVNTNIIYSIFTILVYSEITTN